MSGREALEQPVGPVEAAGADEPGHEPDVLDQEPVRVGDADPGADRQELAAARRRPARRCGPAARCPRPGGRRATSRSRPGRSRAGSSCSSRTAALARSASRSGAVGDERVALRVAGDPDLARAGGRSRPSRAAATARPGSRPAPSRRRRRRRRGRRRRPRARRRGRARWARSRIIRAERCGTARKPAAWSCSHSATVASIPLAGEAVTDTVAPGGRNAAWSMAFLSGMSSNVGARERRRPAPRARPASQRRAAPEEHGHLRRPSPGIDGLAPGDEVEQRLVDARVDAAAPRTRRASASRSRWPAARRRAQPSSSHCSKLLLSAISER